MSRRKLKSDRELIADVTRRTKLFCDSYYDTKTVGCSNCPLIHYDITDCREAYMHYILFLNKNKEKKVYE